MTSEDFQGLLEEFGNESLDGPTITLPVWLERGTRNSAEVMKMPLEQYVTVALCLQNMVVLSTDSRPDKLA